MQAKCVVADHGGAFPSDAATLATLPGVGRSTAAAIAAFASGERGAILDGNVKRVLARHAGIAGYPGEPRVQALLWQAADARVPDAGIERYTQGMMDLGATVCVRRPRCLVCPVADDCVARREGRIDELPAARPRRALPQREIRVLVVERDDAILFERRPATGIWGGLLSLPEVAIDDDVERALRERYALTAGAARDLAPLSHGFTHFSLTMHPRHVAVASRTEVREPGGTVWLSRCEALDAALPSPIKKLLRAMATADTQA